MDAQSLVGKLNDNGITVRAARNTALADVAADLPPPVLAQLIGIRIGTAIRWAGYARRDWSAYLTARLQDTRRRTELGTRLAPARLSGQQRLGQRL
jgi:hypothetical protein